MYIKINSSVNLSSGLTIPSGSVVTIAEGYADLKSEKDGIIPAQVATFLYASEAAIEGEATPVQGVADFNPVFSGLELPVADYQTKTAEALLVDAVKEALVAVYGEGNVEVVA
tara:strand:+ start:219 stop:557 length:339 start_codon:yes stop_codon:yes gene_type:complete